MSKSVEPNKEHIRTLLEASADYQKQLQVVVGQKRAYAEQKAKLSQELAAAKQVSENLEKTREELHSKLTASNMMGTLEAEISLLREIRKADGKITDLNLLVTQTNHSWSGICDQLVTVPDAAPMQRARLPLIPFFDNILFDLKRGDKIWRMETVEGSEDVTYMYTETVVDVGVEATANGSKITVTYLRNGKEPESATSASLNELFDEHGRHSDLELWPQLPTTVMNLAVQQEILKTMFRTVRPVFVDT